MTGIVVSRRDGILTAPDGSKHRVARGKTLADADHPAVLANPRDWTPMVVTFTVGDRPEGVEVPASHTQVEQFENDLAELEETLAQRDAELSRLARGLEAAGLTLPAEDERAPGWLVDLALEAVGAGLNALKAQTGSAAARAEALAKLDKPAPAPEAVKAEAPQPAAPIAPPKSRKRTVPPITTRTGDDA